MKNIIKIALTALAIGVAVKLVQTETKLNKLYDSYFNKVKPNINKERS